MSNLTQTSLFQVKESPERLEKVAGKIKYSVRGTSDKIILETVRGDTTEFENYILHDFEVVLHLYFEDASSSGYIYYFFTKEYIFSICEENIRKTIRLYVKLCFDINF